MIRFISIFIIIFLNAVLFAQAPAIQWTKILGGDSSDAGNCVQQTGDGGYIIVGTTWSFGAGASDIWLIRTDSSGDTLWTQSFGNGVSLPFTGRESGSSADTTSDGGYIIVGNWETRRGYFGNIVLIKTNSNGDSLWMRHFGAEGSHGVSAQQTANEGFIIAGHNWYNAILIKTDANGDTLWTKTFVGSGILQGSKSVQQTSDGGYVLCGNTYSSGNIDVILIKTDANGDTLWMKTFGGSNNDYGYSVQQTSDSGYVLCGYTNSYGSGDFDAWIIKTDANGDTLWTKTLGGSGADFGFSMQQTSDGGYVLCGYTNSFGAGDANVWLTKLAPDITAIDQQPTTIISDYQSQQNYPNPFNPKTTIKFSLPQSSFVTLRIYNILGEEVATLVSERLNAGNYRYEWDAKNFASGIYLYRLVTGDYAQFRKMILLK